MLRIRVCYYVACYRMSNGARVALYYQIEPLYVAFYVALTNKVMYSAIEKGEVHAPR